MVKACIDSGLTVTEWCNANGINIKTYYCRLKRVRESLYELKERRDIIPVYAATTSTAPEASITIKTNKITLELPANISEQISFFNEAEKEYNAGGIIPSRRKTGEEC